MANEIVLKINCPVREVLDALLPSVDWALENEVLTADEASDLLVKEIVENISFTEEK